MSDIPTGWTMHTLHLHLTGQIQELRVHTDQRFNDSEKAVKSALEAADKAVAAALSAQKEAAQKAEKSAVDRHAELVQRLNATADILTEKITALALRYEGSQGGSHGMERAWGFMVAAAGIVIAIGSVALR